MAEAVKAKPKVIAKSLILYDVKPYEAETDLDALAAKILAITMDGLFWKSEYKKDPIAYGVCKLVVGCVIEDAKVSADDIQEQIEAFEEEVQSVDIAVFSKI
jgi:elongation factor 1-beta